MSQSDQPAQAGRRSRRVTEGTQKMSIGVERPRRTSAGSGNAPIVTPCSSRECFTASENNISPARARWPRREATFTVSPMIV